MSLPERRFSPDLFERYASTGHQQVEGWIGVPGVIDIMRAVAVIQDEQGVRGSICEIGIHHGRFFLVLYLLLRQGETALAVDLFGEQAIDPDGSGIGDAEKLLANLDRHAGDRSAVRIVRGDSTRLAPSDLSSGPEGRFRLFSVDGGHSAAVTCHDLELAEKTLAEGGVIIVDDYFNHGWPGVSEGVNRYFFKQQTRLEPILIGSNKVLFAFDRSAAVYRARLRELMGKSFMWENRLFDHPVVVLKS
jgi:hypothetical protein